MTIGMSATVVSALTQLTPSASLVNFGNGVVGVAETQNVMLTNTGNSNLSISAVSASGTGFSASGESNVTLTPNQALTVTVTFDAANTGAATGNLTVMSNGGALQIALAGTGVNTPAQHSVALHWNPSTSAVVGYFVYRGDGLNGALSRLIASTTPATNYSDSTVVSGQSYNYAVTSMDSNNVESTYSNQVSLTVPSP
jgi:Abnormal spindle-like microcephaly-assoc'd, ASPM-SPD-2-Hydin